MPNLIILCCVLLVAGNTQGPGQRLPIRLIGVLNRSPPIAPHKASWGPLVPCGSINADCWRGGYPAVAAWMEHLSHGVRGTVKVITADIKSRTVFGHSKGLELNYDVWERLQLDFVTLPDDHILDIRHGDANVERFLYSSPLPISLVGIVIRGKHAYLTDLFSSWYIKKIDGITIGIFTLWSPWFHGDSTEAIPYEFVIPFVTRRLRGLGVDKIIVLRLGHKGVDGEEVLLTTYDIDVVVLATLSGMEEGVVRNGTTVLVAPLAKRSSEYPVVVVDLLQGETGWSYSLQEISPFKSDPPHGRDDPLYQRELGWMQEQLVAIRQNDYVVATSMSAMPGVRSTLSGINPCRKGECELGNLFADATKGEMKTEVAIINAGSIRGFGWAAGEIRRSHIWETFPFADVICRFNLTGAMLLAAINHGTSRLLPNGSRDPANNLGLFPQVSGIRFSVNPSLTPYQRVVSLDIWSDGKYNPVEKRRLYSVAASSYIAKGGDEYTMLRDNRQDGSYQCSGRDVTGVVEGYLKGRAKYYPAVSSRITVAMKGDSLIMVNHTRYNCTIRQKLNTHWSDCVDCPEGFWHPDVDSPACVEELSSGVNVARILFIIGAGLVVIMVPVVWKLTEKQRRINALYKNSVVAEKCAKAIGAMQLEEVQFLKDIPHPNGIQKAFIEIIGNLMMYRPYLPAALLRTSECSSSIAVDEATLPGRESSEATIVFTDIRSSTTIWETAPEGMRLGLLVHNAVIREATERYNGYEVKTIGDAFMLAFQTPLEGMECALQIHQQLRASEWPLSLLEDAKICEPQGALWGGLTVRIGLNTGPVSVEINTLTSRMDYFGHTVNVASRLESVCIPGAIAVCTKLWSSLEKQCAAVAADAIEVKLKGVSATVWTCCVWPNSLAGRRDIPLLEPVGTPGEFSSYYSNPLGARLLRRDESVGTPVHHQQCTSSTVGAVQLDVGDPDHSGVLRLMSASITKLIVLLDKTTGTLLSVMGGVVFVGWGLKGGSPHLESGIRFAQLLQRMPMLWEGAALVSGVVLRGDVGSRAQRFVAVMGKAVQRSLDLCCYASQKNLYLCEPPPGTEPPTNHEAVLTPDKECHGVYTVGLLDNSDDDSMYAHSCA